MHVLVTGSNGFIGRHLCPALRADGHDVLATTRSEPWHGRLAGVDAVVHLANIAHRAASPGELHRVNVEGTRDLASEAARAGVTRFVFVSSVKALGEKSPGRPLDEADDARPEDAYGVSKRDAERALASVADSTGLDVTILRPTLVYGPGVKANFLRLMQLVDRGLPLPLRSIRNKRSFTYVGNLASAVLASLSRSPPALRGGGLSARTASPRLWLIDDGQPVSTPELTREIARALDRRARLLPFPAALVRPLAARLTDDLEVSSARIRAELDWQPPFTRQAGLQLTASWFRNRYA